MWRACPQCRHSVRRVQSHGDAGARPGMRRYRCRDARCGWEGWLDRSPAGRPRSKRAARVAATEQAARARQSRLTTALLVLISVAVAGVIAWARQLPASLVGEGSPLPESVSAAAVPVATQALSARR